MGKMIGRRAALLLAGMLLAGCVRAERDPAEAAQETLITYFDRLSSGSYAEAAALFGGDLSMLIGMNPTVPHDETARLFELACTANGYACLPVREVLDIRQDGPDSFLVTVSFTGPDGLLFEAAGGPCCRAAAEDEPLPTAFTFSIRRVDGRFHVMDLPIYSPLQPTN
jgi:hypothetical protein